MRGSIAGARALLIATAIVTSAAVGCERTWVLPGQPGGGSGERAGASGNGTGGAGKGGSTGGRSGAGSGGQAGNSGMGGGGLGSPFGSGGFPGSGGRAGSSCVSMSQPWEIHPADVMFLVSRNLSMQTSFGDTSRMSAVQQAIVDVVNQNQNAVKFEYQDFPALAPCSMACCPSDGQLIFLSDLKGSAAIEQAIERCDQGPPQKGCVSPSDTRPLSQMFMKALSTFKSFAENVNDRYVVLLIDGPPGCGEDATTDVCGTASAAFEKLARDAYVNSFVVALGDVAANDKCVKQLARGGAPFTTSDLRSLSPILNQIVAMAAPASCTIDLNFPPSDYIAVYIGGSEIPHDYSMNDGWSFSPTGHGQIVVHGAACRMLQGAAHSDIKVKTGCTPCGDTGIPCTP